MQPQAVLPKPPWLRTKLYSDTNKVSDTLSVGLETICKEAACPNRSECWHAGTATFLILGRICMRACRFCNVETGRPQAVDPEEPKKLADAAEALGLNYTVVTSVNRDDLPDGGASHFVRVMEALRARIPQGKVELLIPDLMGNWDALAQIVSAAPDVLGHNVETVPSLYAWVRPKAEYKRSLDLFREVKKQDPQMLTKSGIILGMGETPDELRQTIADLVEVGVDILTLGQYLQPSRQHLKVVEYIHPDAFTEYGEYALRLGFRAVASGVFVRSSYKADELYQRAKQHKTQN